MSIYSLIIIRTVIHTPAIKFKLEARVVLKITFFGTVSLILYQINLPFWSNIHMGYYNFSYILVLRGLYIGRSDDSIDHIVYIGILVDGHMGNCNFRDDDNCDTLVPALEIFRTNRVDLLKIYRITRAPSDGWDPCQVRNQTILIMSHLLE